jgi:hypothetical protein
VAEKDNYSGSERCTLCVSTTKELSLVVQHSTRRRNEREAKNIRPNSLECSHVNVPMNSGSTKESDMNSIRSSSSLPITAVVAVLFGLLPALPANAAVIFVDNTCSLSNS